MPRRDPRAHAAADHLFPPSRGEAGRSPQERRAAVAAAGREEPVHVRYETTSRSRVDAVVLSTQHSPDISLKDLQEAVMEDDHRARTPDQWLDKNTQYHINPTGRFVIGGPMRRLRSDGPQDHRRQLRRLAPPRRRRVLAARTRRRSTARRRTRRATSRRTSWPRVWPNVARCRWPTRSASRSPRR